MNTTTPTPNTLLQRWNQLQEQNPKLRIRDAAQKLGVSEAELLATGCGRHVTRLEGNWGELLQKIPELGVVMALTRHAHAVHERIGTYGSVNVEGHMGLVVGKDIDLRIFLGQWKAGFAVTEETSEGVRRSLQFFDGEGTAVHKIYLKPESRVEVYEAIVAQYTSKDQSTNQPVTAVKPTMKEKPDSEIDAKGFQEAWRGMKDTHEFFIMLRKFGVTRIQALRLAPAGMTRQVAVSSVRNMLEGASLKKVQIMVFVGSPGLIQIHTGLVENIKVMGPWLNVLDDTFNLHMREDKIVAAWIVKKPTADGEVTSLEIFDDTGDNIALFFGKRKPGQVEATDWRELAATLS